MPTEVLRLDNIVKTFTGVTALKDVSFDVRSGEVHALVGENGAGKSTLIAVAAGVLEPDSGTVSIGGHWLSQASPEKAQELGIGVVYQHTSLLDDLTVTENLVFSLPEHRRPRHADAPSWVREHLASVGVDVSPSLRAEELSIAQRQLVEIARALALESRVLVLDEPTESLTAAESERLFEQVERLRASGAGIVYISHRFPEVQRIADRITVLRDGAVRGTFAAQEVTEDDVLQLIVGRQVDHVFPEKLAAGGPDGEPMLRLTGLSGARFSGIDLDVHPGEIIGLAGVEGNGQRDFLRALAGLSPFSGEVQLNGRAISLRTPAEASEQHVVHLPGDRHAEGVFLPLSVRENASVLVLRRLSQWGVVRRSREVEVARTGVDSLSIRTPDIETPVAALSGGNQQKVAFARSLAADPLVLLADEPTRGVDVGARVEIYRLLRAYADEGHVVIVRSTDATELAGLCDRVMVFSRGQIVQRLSGDELSERSIMGASLTSSVVRDSSSARARASRWRGLAGSDHFPGGILAVIIVLLALYTAQGNPLFLGGRSMSNMLLLTAILAIVSCGQLTVLLVGSIDLSVGPLMGLSVVVMSFFATNESGNVGLVKGIIVALVVGALVGLTNGIGIRVIRLNPVIATLVTYIFLQGVALLLRPNPDGYIDGSSSQLLQTKVGMFPVVMGLAIVLMVVMEWSLRRTRAGIQLRAVGSNEDRARRLGARVSGTVIAAHVVCGVLAAGAGVILTSLVGIGQAGLGAQYTLTSIAAVVLAGASIFGGRGSYVGALLGALLIQEIVTATSFLGLASAWQEWLPGLLILVGAGVFSRARGHSGLSTAG